MVSLVPTLKCGRVSVFSDKGLVPALGRGSSRAYEFRNKSPIFVIRCVRAFEFRDKGPVPALQCGRASRSYASHGLWVWHIYGLLGEDRSVVCGEIFLISCSVA